ncbi:MAG: hypothetical protein QOE11_3239 [Solirubrobacteraceae bacterium]|jgi:ribosomal protein S25|nr:hypothetical protein [Solirubrobacteraceae bacterium]
MADFLDEKRSEIAARVRELKPLVEEYRRLEAAAAALGGVPSPRTSSTHSSRARGRPPAAATAKAAASTRKRGRPKGSGVRAKEALELVRANPGITISEIADKMGIKQNYLYRVLPSLAEDGLVVKSGRGWHVKEQVPVS